MRNRKTNTFRRPTLLNLSEASILAVFVIGLLTIVEWIAGIPLLNQFFSSYSPMKLITAILMVLSSFSLWIFLRQSPWRKHVLRITGGIILLVGFLTFLTYLWGNIPDQHNYIFFNIFFQPGNRMALITTLIFLFLGVIFILLANNSRTQDDLAHVLFFPAASLSYFSLISYVLDVSDIFRIEGINIAPLTAFSFFLLCIVILFVKPGTWLIRILSGPGPGSIMGRRLLPWLLVLPVVIAWVRIKGEQQDHFPMEIGAIVAAITYTLSFLFLVGWSAWSVNRLDESRRKAEEDKKQSDQNYAITLASIGDAVIATDENDRITLMNKEAERLTGWRLQEAVTQPVNNILKLINNHTLDAVGDLTARVKAERAAVRLTEGSLLLSRDGRKIPIDDSGAPILTDEGRMVGIVIVFRDVTESEKAHDALRESEARLNALITATSDVVYRMSPDWNQMYSLKGGIFLTSVESPIDDWLHNFIPKDFQPQVLDTIRKAIHTKSKFELEHKVIRIDGTIGWTLSRAIPLLDEYGEIVEWVGIASDFTDRKHAEEALRKSEQRMKALIRATSNAIYRMSPNWDTIYLLTGEFFNEAENQPYKPEVYIPADSLSKVLETISNAIKNKRLFELEHQVYLPDRSIGWTLSRAIPILNEKGEIEEWFGFAEDITQRKKAEQALVESEQRYSALFTNKLNAMAHCQIITDEQGKAVDLMHLQVNEAYEQIMGIKKKDIEGKTVREIYPSKKESAFSFLEIYGKVAMEGKEQRFDIYFEQSGQYLDIYAYSPKPGEFIAIFTDITQKVKMEKDLQQSEELFSKAFHNIPVPAIITRVSDNIMTNVNINFLKLFEYSHAEVMGHTTKELNLFTNYEQRMKALEILIKEGYLKDHEFDMMTKTGKKLTLLISSVFVLIHEQRHVLTTYFDITERKATERKMGQLSAIIQHSELAIISKDLNGMIQTWNAGAEKIYGFTVEEVTGKNISILLPEGENNEIPELINKVLQDEKIEIYETNRIRKDGTVISVSNTLSPIRDASGVIVAISSISADISELKKVEEALRAKERAEDVRKGAEKALSKLNEELTRSNQELQQFAYLASHDLQEPLRTISTFTQFLAQRYQGHFDEEGKQFIHYIVESALRLKNLINDLMTYSMVGSRTLPFAEVDFNEVFEKVVQNLAFIIQEKNAVITHGPLPSVLGDESQLIQLLQNLVDNSLKFCKRTPHISISAKEEPEEYLFSVRDNGIGIDQKYADKIFLIFQRLVARHEYKGTGIGLAVSKRIAERHGGNICFESNVGEGTTFYFTIAKNHEHQLFATETQGTPVSSAS
ncbi:MAG TPA: PAS domain S-box protein [Prolixibacteraceae bacterium]|nr:PAS domain S-box protein [Prolixibacteraceae bacterium]